MGYGMMNSLEDTRAMSAAFRYFFHMDHQNAAIHMAPVRYSPITFMLAKQLDDEARRQDMMYDGDQIYIEVGRVRAHAGAYPEDKGR